MVLMPCSAIVASRDRKVRELFAVASLGTIQSHDGVATTDAPTSSQALEHFLQANDILQYVRAIGSCVLRVFPSAFRGDIVVSQLLTVFAGKIKTAQRGN